MFTVLIKKSGCNASFWPDKNSSVSQLSTTCINNDMRMWKTQAGAEKWMKAYTSFWHGSTGCIVDANGCVCS